VRMIRRASLTGLFVGALLLGGPARAQETQVLMPEQSAAKAKQLLELGIQALGGATYLNERDSTCTYRDSQFGHSGELTGYPKLIDYEKLPDKSRVENSGKRNIIYVFNGDKGWIMDRGGVQDASEDVLAERQDNLKKDIDNVLHNRIKEPGMIFRYAGPDTVDLREADWVELVDRDGRTIRIAFERSTHLPVRKIVITRDPNTRLRVEEVEYYSNYHPIQGIQTPFQVSSERNGLKTGQIFLEDCKYNTGLSDSLFTKESLDERWSKVGKKMKKK
jgi:outer membrane lipoprotein-sorting protein